MSGDFADLYLLCTLRYAVAAMMPVDMFEGLISCVSLAAKHLHGPVRGFTNKAVGSVVCHGNLIGYCHVIVLIQIPRSFIDKISHHFRFGMQLGQRKLDRLIDGQRFAPGYAFLGIGHSFINAVLRSTYG